MQSNVEKTVLIFVMKDEKLLLLERSNTWFENGKSLTPGGLVDKEETIEQAAVRELEEETGIKVDTSKVSILDKPSVTEAQGRTFKNYNVLVTKFAGTAENLEPDRHTNIGWFSLNNLPKNTSQLVLSKLKYLNNL